MIGSTSSIQVSAVSSCVENAKKTPQKQHDTKYPNIYSGDSLFASPDAKHDVSRSKKERYAEPRPSMVGS